MAKQIQEMVCITCPIGCRMELEIVDGELKAVQHNSCQRGVDYARQEFYDPRRMVTTTAAVSGGVVKRVPVRTSEPLPIQQVDALLQAIYDLRLEAPLDIETPVIENFAETGVDVITTRNLPRAS
jgi:CxxC motif-containing protein